MARPKKKGIDYFPHDCITGKTIFILEQKFKNDGYAFWFKLLEFLGTKENHCLDCNDIPDMEFLQAKTHLSGDNIIIMLDLLASLDAIDRELWKNKLVWSQRFVDGISVVYANRRMKTPDKPSFYTAKPRESQVPTLKGTQSRVEKSKEEYSNTGASGPVGFINAMRERFCVSSPNYSKSDEDFSALHAILDFIRQQVEITDPLFDLNSDQEKQIQDVWDLWIPVIVKKFITKSLAEIAKFKRTEISNIVKNGGVKKTEKAASSNGVLKGEKFSEDFSEVIFSDETRQRLNEDQKTQAKFGMINATSITKGIFN